MFIGHLPASYLVTCALDAKAPDLVPQRIRPLAVKVFLLAGIFPDIDLLYFYLIDNRSQHHHLYWTHLPFCWLVLYVAFLVISLRINLAAQKRRAFQVVSTAFFLGILLHLIMDTPVGGIAWAYPFSTHLYQWVVVPSRYGWWVWNFLLHWTFVFEILICIAVLVVFLRKRTGFIRCVRRPRAKPEPMDIHSLR